MSLHPYSHSPSHAGEVCLAQTVRLRRQAIEAFRKDLIEKYGRERYHADPAVIEERVRGIHAIRCETPQGLFDRLHANA